MACNNIVSQIDNNSMIFLGPLYLPQFRCAHAAQSGVKAVASLDSLAQLRGRTTAWGGAGVCLGWVRKIKVNKFPWANLIPLHSTSFPIWRVHGWKFFNIFSKFPVQGKFKFVTHAPVKRSYKRGFTTYYDRGSAYWIMSCTCKIVEKAPSPPAQFASMPHACQWAPFAARTAADRFCRLYSVPRSVGQAGDPGGVYLGEAATRVFHSVWFPAPCSRFTWCSLQIVTGAVDPPFPKLTYGLCNLLPSRNTWKRCWRSMIMMIYGASWHR